MRNLPKIRALVALSAVICAYLLVTTIQHGHLAGCAAESTCEDVLGSRWGYWAGVPISAPALLIYCAALAATFWATPSTPPRAHARAMTCLAVAAWFMLAAAVWFVTLQAFVIRHLCPYCLAAHFSAAAAAILIVREAPRPSRSVMGAALIGVILLVAGQWIRRPATHEVRSVAATTVQAPSRGDGRQLAIFDGLFKVKVDEVPVLGAADAPAVMVSLFDYTCPHCRQMHAQLLATERAHHGQLAIATLPMPLDSKCNHLIQQTNPKHANACQLARLGLAVWRADRTKMHAFNDWIFEPPVPPGMSSALGYANELVGTERLGPALNDPWVERQLAQDIAIYAMTSKHFGNSAMPQLIVGTTVVFGELENGPADLEALLPEILR